MTRTLTVPFNQVIDDCLVKSHAKLLSNYFCNILRINDPKIIGSMSKKFDILLSKYSVDETDPNTRIKSTVKGYGGGISDVIGKIFIDIHNPKNKVLAIKNLSEIFTKDQIKKLIGLKPRIPDITIEDSNVNGVVVNPGAPNIIATIDEFIVDAHKHPTDNKKFITYFAIEFLLTPCFFYWMATLDQITNKTDINGYVPNPYLLHCIAQELATVSWQVSAVDGDKYVSSDKDASHLQRYLSSIGKNPDDANNYKGYPAHSSIVKGVGTYAGEDCVLMQNSWGLAWNAKFCGSRPISRKVIDMVSCEVIMITPDANGFGFKRRRPNKTNKNKKKPKSPKKGTRKRK
jgi:hypothetical protein